MFCIAGVTTLAAGLGGTELTQRGVRKDRKAEASRQDALAGADRRRVAYADLVTTAEDMQLFYDQMIALRQHLVADHPDLVARYLRGEETGRQLGRAIAIVQLVGSDAAREAVRAVSNATVLVSRKVREPDFDLDAANAAGAAMFNATDAFLDAVRPRRPRCSTCSRVRSVTLVEVAMDGRLSTLRATRICARINGGRAAA